MIGPHRLLGASFLTGGAAQEEEEEQEEVGFFWSDAAVLKKPFGLTPSSAIAVYHRREGCEVALGGQAEVPA